MFNLIFQGKDNNIPQNFPKRGEIKRSIFKALKINGKYEVESNVSEEVFLSFIKYIKENEEPEINEFNKQEYLKLSKEFQIMGNLLTNDEDERNECLNNIKLLKDCSITDKSKIEKQISQDLDNYLKLCGEELLESPINSLFNIFSNPCKIFSAYNLCYNLIKHHYEKHQDLTIFIILKFLDGIKLDQNNLKDAIKSRHLRLNFMPQIEFSFVLNLIEKYDQLSIVNKQLEKTIQIQSIQINSLKKTLFEFILKNSDEFDSNQLKINFFIPTVLNDEKWEEESISKYFLKKNGKTLITVNASSTYITNNKDHAVVHLFNGKKEGEDFKGLRWATKAENKGYIELSFIEPIAANILSLTPRYSKCIHQAPSNFKIYGGNNFDHLTLLGREFKDIKWTDSNTKNFLFNNLNEYSCYKIEFISESAGHVGLSELNLGELSL